MFSDNTDSILFVLTLLVSYNIFTNYNQQKEINKLKRIEEVRASAKRKADKKNKLWHIEAPKILQVGELNARSIKDLSDQQQLLNRYIGEVLNISNLIPSKELGIEAMDIIQELRQRAEWNKEIEARPVDDEEYYKGD